MVLSLLPHNHSGTSSWPTAYGGVDQRILIAIWVLLWALTKCPPPQVPTYKATTVSRVPYRYNAKEGLRIVYNGGCKANEVNSYSLLLMRCGHTEWLTG